MKIIRFMHAGRSTLGVLQGSQIQVLSSSLFQPLAYTGETVPLGGITYLPPIVPPTFYAAGVNYESHLKSVAAKKGVPFKLPTQSHIGYRAVNALTGHDSPVVIPSDSGGKLQFEGELVAVIGKVTRRVTPSEALSNVFGYTIGNDISERQWQAIDRTLWRAKNCDTFKPMGPWIETNVDLDMLITTVRVNDNEVSRFKTNDMIFGVGETIAEISRYITLVPGDVVWMGTDDPTLDLVAGDRVEVEIDGIGCLSNELVNERLAGT